jgi:pimeloyl-ACP methyl ester carboxylesterase
MRRALLLASVIALTACGGGGSERPTAPAPPKATVAADLLRVYDYDASAPLEVEEIKAEQKDGATVHDITYAGPAGRIDAYLMIPKGDGPFPAVLFMPGAPGARFTFFTEALELAKRGIASLLPDPPYTRPPIEDVVDFTPADRDGIVQEVVEMRRGIDLLVSRDDIDPRRLGYVGFSWGGSLGAIFSAVERRVGSFVLMSLVPRLSADMRRLGEERGASDLAGYEAAMKPIDAVNYLPHVAPHALFIQFGAQDTRPSPADSQEAVESASKPRQARAYEAEHELNADARADRENWLAQRLGVD